MSKDIFGYTPQNSTVGGVLNFQNAAISVGGKDGAIMLVQSANLRYNRTVSPVMGAGTASVYLVAQPASGQLDVNRAILTSSTLLEPFSAEDGCKPQDITIALVENGCSKPKGGTITASGLLSSVQVNINVGGGLGLQDGASWTLTNLTVNSSGGGKSKEQGSAPAATPNAGSSQQ